MLRTILLSGMITCLPNFAAAQSRGYPPTFEGSRAETYKSVEGVDLRLWIFEPEGHAVDDARPSIVFFFGGGWRGGSPGQFEPHCRYLARRGMVAITADYRVSSRHEVLADRCVADAKSAVRWVRQHAARLGIDPDRIVAGGGSAGGHLAACTATILALDEPQEDAAVSSVPNALALFNPALVLDHYEGLSLDQGKLAELATRTGVSPQELSPIHHIRAGLPPTIIFHGQADTTVPYETAEAYERACRAAGNRCELKGYAGAAHGFFNHRGEAKPNDFYSKTVEELDRFLVSLGYLAD